MAIIPPDKKIEDTPKVKFENIHESAQYSEEYKEVCYRVWYDNRQPGYKALSQILPEDEYGRIPTTSIVAGWKRGEDGWVARARKLDEEAKKRTDEIVVRERVDMFVQHALAGSEMVELGLEYLEKNGIHSDAVAIRAIKEGTDLERKSLGIAELLKKISTMSDSQLQSRAEELSAAAEDDDSIIDAELRDVEEENDE